MRSTKTTIQSYPPGTQWTFRGRQGGYVFTEELVLYPEPDCASMSDEYLPEEANALELWRRWVDKYAVTYHQKDPDRYRLGEVPIFWSVTKPSFTGIFEAAPYTQNVVSHDFLTHYTPPVNEKTGEPLNWNRLRVMDLGWNSSEASKGGFIQEATGWKPCPLQPTMDFLTVGRAAGVYVPDLR